MANHPPKMKRALFLTLAILTAWQVVRSQSSDRKDSSSGWLPIQIASGQLLVPVTINGQAALAHLVNSIDENYIDKDFVDRNSIPYDAPTEKKKVAALTIQIGGLTVNQAIRAILMQHQDRTPAVDVILGDDIFKAFTIDIDFPHQRIAFHRPGGMNLVKGVAPLAFKQNGESRAVPASIEGGPPKFYWVYLGDPAPVSVYQNYFTDHAMLQGRAHSIRMGGGSRTPPEAIATVRIVNLASARFYDVPGVFPDDSVTGAHPAEVAGHIGLGILLRCRVIFDYSHDQLYVIPGSQSMVRAPFPKDRSGLAMRKVQENYVVRFVCPGSPAMKAGFQVGDTVTKVNDQPLSTFVGTAWQLVAWTSVDLTNAGTTYRFEIKDGTARKLTTADFF
jgi:hypothetical protein